MKRKILGIGAVSVVLSLVIAVTTMFSLANNVNAQVTLAPLDHFQCYITGGQTVRQAVRLRDQFLSERAWVIRAVRLCNPVQKKHGPIVTQIINPDNHLTFYKIKPEKPTVERHVIVSNQFGDGQPLRVKDAIFLAAPTQKIHPNNHGTPIRLDHFKCYKARGNAVNVPVGLEDQFFTRPSVGVRQPVLLCNPVEKIHSGQTFTPEFPDAHLVCYRIQTRLDQLTAMTRTQFLVEDLIIGRADLLCVPSLKFHQPPPDTTPSSAG